MRTVNRKAISLIHAKKSGKASANTKVVSSKFESLVYLHDHHIATYDHENRALYCRDAGWQTRTTADRLNALLAEFAPAWRIVQRDWCWYIDDRSQDAESLTPWPGHDTFH